MKRLGGNGRAVILSTSILRKNRAIAYAQTRVESRKAYKKWPIAFVAFSI
ncbi:MULTISPECIES: hypothetical protein [Aerosakkonema]